MKGYSFISGRGVVLICVQILMQGQNGYQRFNDEEGNRVYPLNPYEINEPEIERQREQNRLSESAKTLPDPSNYYPNPSPAIAVPAHNPFNYPQPPQNPPPYPNYQPQPQFQPNYQPHPNNYPPPNQIAPYANNPYYNPDFRNRRQPMRKGVRCILLIAIIGILAGIAITVVNVSK